MKTLYIHMGNLKTGSTAIQAYLFKNKKKLLEKYNLLIPQTIAHNFTVYSGEPYYIHKGFEEITENDAIAFQREVATAPDCDILISNEWYNGVTRENYDFLKKLLPDYDIKVIFYVRRVDSFIKSLFNEQRKRRVLKEYIFYESYIQNGIKYFTANAIHRIQTSINTLGKDNVIVKLYDRKSLKNNDIICDFFDIFSIEIKDNSFTNVNASVLTEGFSYLSAAQSVLSNESIPFYTEQYNRIFHLFLNAQKSIPQLSPEVKEAAIKNIHASIDEMEKYIPGYKSLYDNKEIDIDPPVSTVTPNQAFLASVLCSVSCEIEKLKIHNKSVLKRLDAMQSTQNNSAPSKSVHITNAELLYQKARHDFDFRYYDKAEKDCLMSIHMYPTAQAYDLLSAIYEKRQLFHVSMDLQYKAMKLDENLERMRTIKKLAQATQNQDKKANAAQTLQSAQTLASQCTQAKSVFSLFHGMVKSYTFTAIQDKKDDLVIAFAQKIIKIKSNMAWPYYVLGIAYWERGHAYLAMQELEKAKQYGYNDPEILAYYYSCLAEVTAVPGPI